MADPGPPKPAAVSCLQKAMNWYCENMGTDDDFTVPNESSGCNLMRYARYDNGEWRCFGELFETTSSACIDDNGERIDCKSGDFNDYCSRPAELTAIKNKRDLICPECETNDDCKKTNTECKVCKGTDCLTATYGKKFCGCSRGFQVDYPQGECVEIPADQASSCLQSQMDWYCEHLGTDDAHTVANEHSTCNSMRYARYDGSEWKCYESLLDDTSEACVNESGQLTTCKSPDVASKKFCSKHKEITEIKNQMEAMCPGPQVCPSTECWDWDEQKRTCSMKLECMSVECGSDSMDIKFRSELFGSEDAATLEPQPDVIPDNEKTADKFHFTKKCMLGDCGMTYKTVNDGAGLEFTVTFTHPDVHPDERRRRSTKMVSLLGSIVNSNPLEIGAQFKCTYPTTFSLDGTFNVAGAILGGVDGDEEDDEDDPDKTPPSLAGGFETAVDSGDDDPIELGARQEFKTTWKLAEKLPKLFWDFSECNVNQGDEKVAIIKNFCYSTALKVTKNAGSGSEKSFSYQTFSLVGATTTKQSLACDVTICIDNCANPKTDDACLTDDQKTDFAPFLYTLAGYSAEN